MQPGDSFHNRAPFLLVSNLIPLLILKLIIITIISSTCKYSNSPSPVASSAQRNLNLINGQCNYRVRNLRQKIVFISANEIRKWSIPLFGQLTQLLNTKLPAN